MARSNIPQCDFHISPPATSRLSEKQLQAEIHRDSATKLRWPLRLQAKDCLCLKALTKRRNEILSQRPACYTGEGVFRRRIMGRAPLARNGRTWEMGNEVEIWKNLRKLGAVVQLEVGGGDGRLPLSAKEHWDKGMCGEVRSTFSSCCWKKFDVWCWICSWL